jgi:hypothetical protein
VVWGSRGSGAPHGPQDELDGLRDDRRGGVGVAGDPAGGGIHQPTYVAAFDLISWLYRRRGWTDRPGAQWALPFASTLGALVLLVNPAAALLIDLSPLVPAHTRWAELTMLTAVMAAGLVLLLVTAKPDRPFDLRRDGAVIFAIPLVLHAYDIAVAFARGITVAYPTSLVVTALHAALLAWLYLRARNRGMPGEDAPEGERPSGRQALA